MPTTASYQTPNSYSELDFKPYNLDYASVLKEASAKTSYWMEGAAKIQQAYSKITGLAPQFIKNKEALNEFNSQVKDKIKKLAGTDLAIQGNANMINDVIAPLYDTSNPISEAILLDDSYNKAGQNLLKTIESYKTKDKGAGYSQNNEKYATEWYQEYMKKAQDPNASLDDLRALRSEIKQYTPYYDFSKELEFAITKCPENKSSTDTASQGYIENVQIISKNTTGCIQSFLSDKAKSQMQIDGYIEYGKNYQVLGNEYKKHALEVNTSSQREIGKLKAQQLTKGITPEVSKALQEQIDAIESEIKYNNNLVSKIDANDYSDIEKNYEQFAGSIYMRNKLKAYAAFNKNPEDNTTITLNDDPAYLLKLKLNNENIQANIDRQLTISENAKNRDVELQKAAAASKGAYVLRNGRLVPTTPGVGNGEEFSTETNLDESGNKVQTEASFNQEGLEIQNGKARVKTDMLTLLNNQYGKNLTMNQLQDFLDHLPASEKAKLEEDDNYKNYKHQLDRLTVAEALHNSQLDYIENQIKKESVKTNVPVTIETEKGNVTKYRNELHKYIVYKERPVRRKNPDGVVDEFVVYDLYYKDPNTKTMTLVKNKNHVNDKYNENQVIREKHYNSAKTLNTLKVTTSSLNNMENLPLRDNIYDAISGITSGESNTPIVKDKKDIRTGKTDGRSKIDIIIPTPSGDKEADVSKKIIQEIGGTGKTVTYKGNGRYEIKYNDPNNFPQELRFSNSSFLTEGLAVIIDNVNNNTEILDNQKVIIAKELKGNEIFINKGNPIIWVRNLKSNVTKPFNNLSELQALIFPNE